MSEQLKHGIKSTEEAKQKGKEHIAAMGQGKTLLKILLLAATMTVGLGYFADRSRADRSDDQSRGQEQGFDEQITKNAQQMMEQGKQIFRYDTFGDEVYWSDKLKLHHAIQGSKFGGVGPGVSPKTDRKSTRLNSSHSQIS